MLRLEKKGVTLTSTDTYCSVAFIHRCLEFDLDFVKCRLSVNDLVEALHFFHEMHCIETTIHNLVKVDHSKKYVTLYSIQVLPKLSHKVGTTDLFSSPKQKL